MNVGVIGLGVMGESHVQAYSRIPGVCVKSVCDCREEKAREVAERYGAKAYTDMNEMLADPSLVAVSVCLPDNLHLDASIMALRAGKHVLVEKPLADTVENGRMIADAAKKADRVFTVGYNLRYDYRYARLKSAVDEGAIGDLIQISCRRNSPITGVERFAGHTDLHIHVTIHDINMVHWITKANPVKAYAKSRSILLSDLNMADCMFALVTYDDGLVVCYESAWNLPANYPGVLDDRIEVIGTKGLITTEPCTKGVQITNASGFQTPDTRHRPILGGSISGILKEELSGFLLSILKNEPPMVTAQEALADLYVAEAIARSIREEREVQVDTGGR